MLQPVSLEVAHQAGRSDPHRATGVGPDPEVAIPILDHRVDRIVCKSLHRADVGDVRTIDIAETVYRADADVPVRPDRQRTHAPIDQPVGHREVTRVVASGGKPKPAIRAAATLTHV